jgi:nitroimidazol reductase NimA-like FMN-containing flavoprotein (pyridoxamine 5'-phosphate oxidase superfamily)
VIGQLDHGEIETLLRGEVVGHLGCHADGKTYVVPITYAYEDGMIYAHSTQGLKLRMMRENPNVCFQVDHIDGLGNWRSAIVWGRFEELEGAAAGHAMAQLLGRLLPQTVTVSATQTSKDLTHQYRVREAGEPAATFCIHVTEATGRFEISQDDDEGR